MRSKILWVTVSVVLGGVALFLVLVLPSLDGVETPDAGLPASSTTSEIPPWNPPVVVDESPTTTTTAQFPTVQDEDWGAQLPPEGFDVTLHVDPDEGLDENDGLDLSTPVRTVERALELASDARSDGNGVRVLLMPGVYRQRFSLIQDPDDSPILVIEAVEPGAAVISGADVWTDWTWDAGVEAFTHEWNFDWGADEWPFEDQPAPDLVGIGGRREVVSVEGTRLDPVENLSDLRDGAFYVDEESDRLYLRPPTGSAFSGSVAEVAVREQLMNFDSVRNVVVRGLTFQHAASPFNDNAVRISNSRNVLFESNRIIENSWTGLGISTSTNLTIRGNDINFNGGGGAGIFRAVESLFVRNDTSFNNWRGAAGGWTGWSIAGVKAVGVHDMAFSQHRAWGNEMRGLWLDYDIVNVSITDSVWCENLLEGLFLEAVQGPVDVSGSRSCDNRGHGLVLVNVYGATISDTVACGNGRPALYMNAERGGRSVTTDDGVIELMAARDLTVTGSAFVGDGPLLDMSIPEDDFALLRSNMIFESNRWLQTGGETGFEFPGGSGDFDDWRAASGQDDDSFWDPSAGDVDCFEFSSD